MTSYDDRDPTNTPDRAITVFRDARSTRPRDARTRKFRDFPDLAKFLRRSPVSRVEKRSIPLLARGTCDGPRLKENLRPPFLVILDVDKSEVGIEEAAARLALMGVDFAAHTTHSHAGGRASSYRIFTDHVAWTWDELQGITEQLFELVGIEATPESHASPCFFVPATHPDRAREYRYRESLTGGSRWAPSPIESEPEDRRPGPRELDVDWDELRAALERVPNHDRERWIEVGMALHSTGHPEGRDLWDEWSQGQDYEDYSDEAQEAAWRSFHDRESGVSVSTIYFRAREAGWSPPSSARDSADSDFEAFATPRARWLRRLNGRYAYVAIGQGVVADTAHPTRPIELKSRRAFLGAYAHPRFPTGQVRADGRPVTAPIGKTWIEDWPRRRTFHRLDFLPPGTEGELDDETLNLWRGWAVEARPERCDRYLEHVREVICSGREDLYRWVVAWMAHAVQRPSEKPGTAIVMRSSEGVGKGVFAQALVDLCGPHGLHVTQPRQLTGNFNMHMASKLVVFADEVTWGGRRLEEGVLKTLITEPTTMLEPKGVDAFQARSFCRLLISSNNEWVVPAGRTARRFLVLDPSEAMTGKQRYYERIVDELRNGGLSGLLWYLRSLDLSEWPSPRKILKTEGLRDQKIQSLDDVDQWILRMLTEGRVSEMDDGWPRETVRTHRARWVSKTHLYESYLLAARDSGAPRRTVEALVGSRLRKVLGRLPTARGTVDEGRRWLVALPSLEDARSAFERYLGHEVDWAEDSEDEELDFL